jgi:hypothetical protein
LTSPADSLTLRRLLANLDMIIARLGDPEGWQGARVGDVYARLETLDSLVSTERDSREYAVGLHEFAQPRSGELHDHRWPFAVYPFGDGLPDEAPLYEMPWEDRQQHGTMTVWPHRPYAIEKCSVRHAVHGLRPHMSLTLTDITIPPARPNRLNLTPLPPDAVAQILARARHALWQTPNC